MTTRETQLATIITNYLTPLFPGQAFGPKMDGPNVTLTVIDSKPTPFAKGFAVSLKFLTMFDQATIVAYFDDIEVAAQLEGVPRSVEITAPLGA